MNESQLRISDSDSSSSSSGDDASTGDLAFIVTSVISSSTLSVISDLWYGMLIWSIILHYGSMARV